MRDSKDEARVKPDASPQRRCRECGFETHSRSIFAHGHFISAAVIMGVWLSVFRLLQGFHIALDATLLTGGIAAVFMVPAFARRFDSCPKCEKRDWETIESRAG